MADDAVEEVGKEAAGLLAFLAAAAVLAMARCRRYQPRRWWRWRRKSFFDLPCDDSRGDYYRHYHYYALAAAAVLAMAVVPLAGGTVGVVVVAVVVVADDADAGKLSEKLVAVAVEDVVVVVVVVVVVEDAVVVVVEDAVVVVVGGGGGTPLLLASASASVQAPLCHCVFGEFSSPRSRSVALPIRDAPSVRTRRYIAALLALL